MSPTRSRALALAICAVLPLAVAIGADGAAKAPSRTAALVKLMLTGPDHSSYWGRKVVDVETGSGLERVEIREFHKPKDKWRFEHVSPSRVAGRVVVIDKHKRQQYEPRKNLLIETRDPAEVSKVSTVELVLRNYRVVEKPGEKVAGKPCAVLEMWPRYKGKAMRKYWIHQPTGVILRRERHRPDGPIERLSAFKEFHPDATIPESKFQLRPAKGQRVISRMPQRFFTNDMELVRRFNKRACHGETLPSGYVRESSAILDRSGYMTVQLVYTDGISYVSLFETRPKGDSQVKSVSSKSGKSVRIRGRSGQLRAHGGISSLTWEEGAVRYTLVSEVTPQLLMHIAEKMR